MKTKRKIFLLIIAVFIFQSARLHAQSFAGSVAVFGKLRGIAAVDALTEESAKSVKRTFSDLGRFIAVEDDAIKKAFTDSEKDNIAASIAKQLNTDIYVYISVTSLPDISYAEVQVSAVNPQYKSIERKFTVRSKVIENIPLKICREIAYMHAGLPVHANILQKNNDKTFIINAGQWHGLQSGRSYACKEASVYIIDSGRFKSLARIHGEAGDSIVIEIYPDIKKYMADIDSELKRNAVRKYSLENSRYHVGDPEDRFVAGMCVINMGGNACAPGYGAFLSTYYLGFNDAKPDKAGVAIATAASAAQFLLVPALDGFKSNFFPWVKDSDKTERRQNLQIFLWSALPLTFSDAYLNQLAYQFKRTELVPPFFEDCNNMAGVMSLLFPGGGFFYKGYNAHGWSFYFTEMSLAGYGVYYKDASKGKYAFAALGAVKVIDIVYAYLIESNYGYYNLEKEREHKGFSFSAGLNESNEELIYNFALNYRF